MVVEFLKEKWMRLATETQTLKPIVIFLSFGWLTAPLGILQISMCSGGVPLTILWAAFLGINIKPEFLKTLGIGT